VIPDDVVERVREEADIVQIIGEHVTLKRMGTDYRGPCPFHQGTHPNFSVSPKKHMYYCFVCKEGGDVFTFLTKRLGLDWPGAVRLVASKSGIEIREVESQRSGPDPREPLWEVTATAAEYFRRMLWDDEGGQPARDYLASRGIDRPTADRFGIGYAPPAIGFMRSHLQTLGFDDARQIAAGVLTQPEEGREPRPRFRGRLIFPIFDSVGHTVGFGGRLIGPGDVKYVNSPESSIFAKRRLLYGLNWSKFAIRRDERVILVEGYFDVVRLLAAGIESVVAPLGTALTSEQAELVARYTKVAYLIYDSDRAGLRATFKSGDELLRRAVSVRVVTLPEGEDPDTFVGSYGAEQLEGHLRSALDVFERKVQLLERSGWFSDLARKRQAIDRLLPTIRATADPILRDMYVTRASEVAGVPRALLWREAGDAAATASGVPAPGPVPPPRRPAEVPRRSPAGHRGRPAEAPYAAERELIRWLLLARAERERVGDRVTADQIRDPHLRAIFAVLSELGPDVTMPEMAAELEPDAVALAEALTAEGPTGADPGAEIEASIAMLQVRELSERSQEIDRLMELATPEEKVTLMREKIENSEHRRKLNGREYKTFRRSPRTARGG
jgi:DNA primase